MANLTDTQLLAAITKAGNSLIDAGEFRDYDHSVTKLLLAGEQDVLKRLRMLQEPILPHKNHHPIPFEFWILLDI